MATIEMNLEQFEKALAGNKPVLVDFWAPWCSYCRRISAAYEKIGEQYARDLVVAKVNIDEENALADREQIDVIPTLILYRNGRALGSVVAPESKAAIDTFIQETLNR